MHASKGSSLLIYHTAVVTCARIAIITDGIIQNDFTLLSGGVAVIDCTNAARWRAHSLADSINRITVRIAQARNRVAIFANTEAIGYIRVIAASWYIGIPSVHSALVGIRTGDRRESAANIWVTNVFSAILWKESQGQEIFRSYFAVIAGNWCMHTSRTLLTSVLSACVSIITVFGFSATSESRLEIALGFSAVGM